MCECLLKTTFLGNVRSYLLKINKTNQLSFECLKPESNQIEISSKKSLLYWKPLNVCPNKQLNRTPGESLAK